MRVLISAYACAPGQGSEPEVGLRTVLAALSAHEIWVITRTKNVAPLELYVSVHAPDLLPRLHVVGIDLPPAWRWAKKRGAVGLYAYYHVWQRRSGRLASSLDAEIGFDLVHHVTFAAYWTRAGVAEADKPMVWGPVGGGVGPPFLLLPVLGFRGVVRTVARNAVQRSLFRSIGGPGSSCRIRLAQNPETARVIGAATVVPNAISILVHPPAPADERRSSDVVFAGRLVPFKAGTLALQVMRFVRDPDARLLICGEGPARAQLERDIHRWGLHGRVELVGAVPREELVRLVASAGVLLHPALHEDAGLAVAEALALRTPVVCLDHGGPAVLSRCWWPASPAARVTPGTPRRTARAMAAAIDGFLSAPEPPVTRAHPPVRTFEQVLLETYAHATSPSTAQGS